jgi:hypothetical protein
MVSLPTCTGKAPPLGKIRYGGRGYLSPCGKDIFFEPFGIPAGLLNLKWVISAVREKMYSLKG